jgi:hypothetical protein
VPGSCNGPCNNGSGTLLEYFLINTPAQYNGTQCGATQGSTRPAACINTSPCPVDCVGSWLPAGACQGPCGVSNGVLPELYFITTAAAHGGIECEAAHGATRSSTECSTLPCPVPCRGVWTPIGCSGECGGGCGFLDEEFNITQPPLHGGLPCEELSGALRGGVRACVNDVVCPVDCIGSYVPVGNCTGTCSTQGSGVLPELFVVTSPVAGAGQVCPAVNGSTRAVTPCIKSDTACPCIGTFVAVGPCMATCSSSGLQYEVYTTTEPLFGGAPCTIANGTARFTTCTNSTVCPWASVFIPDTPQVLPPLTVSMNDSGVVIKGGNVTISGITLEAVSNGSAGSATAGSFTVGSGGTNAGNGGSSRPLRTRIAAFNGNLGFYTLGLTVDVQGEFELQRSMAWAWDTTYSAWTSQVRVCVCVGGGGGNACACAQHTTSAAWHKCHWHAAMTAPAAAAGYVSRVPASQGAKVSGVRVACSHVFCKLCATCGVQLLPGTSQVHVYCMVLLCMSAGIYPGSVCADTAGVCGQCHSECCTLANLLHCINTRVYTGRPVFDSL